MPRMDLTLPAILAVCSAVISFICAGAGAYFGSYLKKKGENLATHEDIAKVLEDLRQVTTTTKEIEAKISGELWDRQKQWELKREILFDATKRLSAVENQLLAMHTVWEQSRTMEEGLARSQLKHDTVIQWRDCIHSLEETEALISVSCSKETMYAFAELLDLLRGTVSKIVQGDTEAYGKDQEERVKKVGRARGAIRKELGLMLDLK
jgi:hypothetical protein